MDEEQYKKLQSELDEYRLKRDEKSEKVLSILTAGKSIGDKPVEFQISEDVSILIKSHIPKSTRSMLLNTVNGAEDTEEGYDSIINAYARFMSDICVEPELKNPAVWLEFEEESGSLIQLGSAIFRDLNITTDDIDRFRRK